MRGRVVSEKFRHYPGGGGGSVRLGATVCVREIPRPAEVRRDFGMTPGRRNREDFRLATTLSPPRRSRASLDWTAEGGCPHISPSPHKPRGEWGHCLQ